MFSTDFIFRQQENLVDKQKCQAGFRPLCNKILFFKDRNEELKLKFPHIKRIKLFCGSGTVPSLLPVLINSGNSEFEQLKCHIPTLLSELTLYEICQLFATFANKD